MFAKLRKFYFITFAVSFAVTAGVWVLAPSLRDSLSQEDMFIESLTATLFVCSAMIGSVCLFKKWNGSGKFLHAVFPVLCILGVLDEVGFGADPENPLMVFGYEVDALHDAVAICFKLWRDSGSQAVDIALFILMLTSASFLFLFRRSYMPWVMGLIKRYPCFDFLRFAMLLLISSLAIDLVANDESYMVMIEEMLEFNGASAMFFAAFGMHYQRTVGDEQGADAV